MNSKFSPILKTLRWSGAHSRIKELANNSEIENLQNKGHVKISDSTVPAFNMCKNTTSAALLQRLISTFFFYCLDLETSPEEEIWCVFDDI